MNRTQAAGDTVYGLIMAWRRLHTYVLVGTLYLQEVHHGRFILVLAIAKERVVICTNEFGSGCMERKHIMKLRWPMGRK
jgi:hypothetical protein